MSLPTVVLITTIFITKTLPHFNSFIVVINILLRKENTHVHTSHTHKVTVSSELHDLCLKCSCKINLDKPHTRKQHCQTLEW